MQQITSLKCYHYILVREFHFNCTFCCISDVTEPLLVEVDQIYHLACPASPIFYKHNPVKVCAGSVFVFILS